MKNKTEDQKFLFKYRVIQSRLFFLYFNILVITPVPPVHEHVKVTSYALEFLIILIFHQIKANTPVLMCSVPGYDASGWVDDLAAELGKQLTSIAIGTMPVISVNTCNVLVHNFEFKKKQYILCKLDT